MGNLNEQEIKYWVNTILTQIQISSRTLQAKSYAEYISQQINDDLN